MHANHRRSSQTSESKEHRPEPRRLPVQRRREIHSKLLAARRELDALIGDAYLRPRASIVPVHFLDLASAVEKLRWAEKEWRELDRELSESPEAASPASL
jgi:hypothetical protein